MEKKFFYVQADKVTTQCESKCDAHVEMMSSDRLDERHLKANEAKEEQGKADEQQNKTGLEHVDDDDSISKELDDQSDTHVEMMSSDRLDEKHLQAKEAKEEQDKLDEQQNKIGLDHVDDDDDDSISKELECLWARKLQEMQKTDAEPTPKPLLARSKSMNDLAYADADADAEQRTNDTDTNPEVVDVMRHDQNTDGVGIPLTSVEAVTLHSGDPLQQDGVQPVSELDEVASLGGTTGSLKLGRSSGEPSTYDHNSLPQEETQDSSLPKESFECVATKSSHLVTGQSLNNPAEGQSCSVHSSLPTLKDPLKQRRSFRHQSTQCSISANSESNVQRRRLNFDLLMEFKSKSESAPNQPEPLPEFRLNREAEKSRIKSYLEARLREYTARPAQAEHIAPASTSTSTSTSRSLTELFRCEGWPNLPACESTSTHCQSNTAPTSPEHQTKMSQGVSAKMSTKPVIVVWTRGQKPFSTGSSEASDTGHSADSCTTCLSSSATQENRSPVEPPRATDGLPLQGEVASNGTSSLPDTSSCACRCCVVSTDCRSAASSRCTEPAGYTTRSSSSSASYQTAALPADVILRQQVEHSSSMPSTTEDDRNAQAIAEARPETSSIAAIVVMGPVKRRAQPTESDEEQEQTLEKPQKQNQTLTYQSQFPPIDHRPTSVACGNFSSRTSLSESYHTARDRTPSPGARSEYFSAILLASPSSQLPTEQSPNSASKPKDQSLEPALALATNRSSQTVFHSAREPQTDLGTDSVAKSTMRIRDDNTEYYTASENPSMMPLNGHQAQSPVLVKLQISQSTLIHEVMHTHYRPNRLQALGPELGEISAATENNGKRGQERDDNPLASEASNIDQKKIKQGTDMKDDKTATESDMTIKGEDSETEINYFQPMPLSSDADIIQVWQSNVLIRKRQTPLDGGLYSQTHRLQFLPIDILHADTAGGPIFEGDHVKYAMERAKYFEQEFAKLSGDERVEDLLLRLRQVRTLQNTAETHYEPHLKATSAGHVPKSPRSHSAKVLQVKYCCPLGLDGCSTLLNAELLAHFWCTHLKDRLNLQLKEVFDDDSVLIIFNPTSFRLATNTCMSMLVYGGKQGDDSTLPLKRFMPVGNAGLPEPYARYVGHLPIIVMICRNKLSAVNGNESKDKDEDEDEDVFALWVITMDLPRPVHVLMTVFNRRLDISRSCIMSMRGLSKSHCCKNFVNASNNFMRISENDMKVLSNGFTEPVYVEVTVKEFPYSCFMLMTTAPLPEVNTQADLQPKN
ncbi:uncharacterized protein LOC111065378 [Drosophila obscura]|uniref:uncharacterized protein LOC111065378 n=1 Tax=Drosophila obscura TaxID=7282 RepID=UPI001BB2C945|nr:uncharacterized protein LOC111065378 [Drosophila obscura]